MLANLSYMERTICAKLRVIHIVFTPGLLSQAEAATPSARVDTALFPQTQMQMPQGSQANIQGPGCPTINLRDNCEVSV